MALSSWPGARPPFWTLLLPDLGTAVLPRVPLLSVTFSRAPRSQAQGGWSNKHMGIGRWWWGSCGSVGETSAAATSWEPWPGCFLKISTYPKEQRSELIPSLASCSFGGGCERSGCRRQVCVCGVGKWGAGRGPLVLHWPGWGWTLQGGCSSRGPAPLGTAGRVSPVPGPKETSHFPS